MAERRQFFDLLFSADPRDALLIAELVTTPAAVWFTGGTPDDVQTKVSRVVSLASRERAVPVLVAYNVPFRDCAQYSAGGAADTASYEAWIEAFAKGIGQGNAAVVLEPDSLGIIPYNTTIYGAADWCKPDLTGTGLTAAQANSERYVQLNFAVDAFAAYAPNASVYLDGVHSAWLGVGEASYRLVTAGVQRAQGFFTNVSNYQPTDQSIQFGTWVSDCIAAGTAGASWAIGHFDYCPSQYNPAENFGLDYTPAYAATVTSALASMLNGAVPTAHFIVDTSRNGNGPLDVSQYAAAPYNQPAAVVSGLAGGSWCNPPGAGLGLRPSANTGVPLLDATLWVKTPGESDGSCDIAGGARAWDYTAYDPWGLSGDAENHFDPLWGETDPAAGAWFPAQALQLAQKANPPL